MDASRIAEVADEVGKTSVPSNQGLEERCEEEEEEADGASQFKPSPSPSSPNLFIKGPHASAAWQVSTLRLLPTETRMPLCQHPSPANCCSGLHTNKVRSLLSRCISSPGITVGTLQTRLVESSQCN